MAYFADILGARGNAQHVVDGRDVSLDVRLIEIREEDGLFRLLRYDATGACITDTVHFSLGEARRQAECEYHLQWHDDDRS